MKTRARRQTTTNGRVEVERPLSPTGAFVVHFRETMPGRPRFSGRAEHMLSGQAVRFESRHDLLAFFARVLDAAHGTGSEER